ncbi:MAG: tRNA (adenosine(37)-N6)-threonylcarbamoyltransferase complex dimerization subunit type 1 TsaB [Alphaproteobacteria bacterium]|nr:tRNA (adenosine(37)-N6)-threonylcarbamoyltransferase complex dimerization subunit type 1 TsaB [Alphaproteobacteria bacterium]
MSLVLAYDCAVSGLGLAVVRDGTPLAVHREEGREQAARLLPAIAELLEKAGLDKRALEMIAVTIGPGSFTGVRVGLAAARGLAVALGIPLAGFATTAVLLEQAPPSEHVVVAAIDTHLGDWYCAIRAGAVHGEGRMPFLATTESLRHRLQDEPALIVGAEADALASALGAEAVQALPDPIVLARLAERDGGEAWRVRNRTEGLPRPLYLRGVNITLPTGERRTVE